MHTNVPLRLLPENWSIDLYLLKTNQLYQPGGETDMIAE